MIYMYVYICVCIYIYVLNGNVQGDFNFYFKDSCLLFCCLYKSWAHNPVATVALCLLTQNYSHVCDLIRLLYPLQVI
jgi:hypothetical protein